MAAATDSLLAFVPPPTFEPGKIILPPAPGGPGAPLVGAALLLMVVLKKSGILNPPPPKAKKQKEEEDREDEKKVLKVKSAVDALETINAKDIAQLIAFIGRVALIGNDWSSLDTLEGFKEYQTVLQPLKDKLRREFIKRSLSQLKPRRRRRKTTYTRERKAW